MPVRCFFINSGNPDFVLRVIPSKSARGAFDAVQFETVVVEIINLRNWDFSCGGRLPLTDIGNFQPKARATGVGRIVSAPARHGAATLTLTGKPAAQNNRRVLFGVERQPIVPLAGGLFTYQVDFIVPTGDNSFQQFTATIVLNVESAQSRWPEANRHRVDPAGSFTGMAAAGNSYTDVNTAVAAAGTDDEQVVILQNNAEFSINSNQGAFNGRNIISSSLFNGEVEGAQPRPRLITALGATQPIFGSNAYGAPGNMIAGISIEGRYDLRLGNWQDAVHFVDQSGTGGGQSTEPSKWTFHDCNILGVERLLSLVNGGLLGSDDGFVHFNECFCPYVRDYLFFNTLGRNHRLMMTACNLVPSPLHDNAILRNFSPGHSPCRVAHQADFHIDNWISGQIAGWGYNTNRNAPNGYQSEFRIATNSETSERRTMFHSITRGWHYGGSVFNTGNGSNNDNSHSTTIHVRHIDWFRPPGFSGPMMRLQHTGLNAVGLVEHTIDGDLFRGGSDDRASIRIDAQNTPDVDFAEGPVEVAHHMVLDERAATNVNGTAQNAPVTAGSTGSLTNIDTGSNSFRVQPFVAPVDTSVALTATTGYYPQPYDGEWSSWIIVQLSDLGYDATTPLASGATITIPFPNHPEDGTPMVLSQFVAQVRWSNSTSAQSQAEITSAALVSGGIQITNNLGNLTDGWFLVLAPDGTTRPRRANTGLAGTSAEDLHVPSTPLPATDQRFQMVTEHDGTLVPNGVAYAGPYASSS